jgi:hypothetical protein
MAITFDWTNFCLLCDIPKQLEEGKLLVTFYQFSTEMRSCQNIIRFQKLGGSYKADPYGLMQHRTQSRLLGFGMCYIKIEPYG